MTLTALAASSGKLNVMVWHPFVLTSVHPIIFLTLI